MTWMNPVGTANNSCPYCRQEFFPKILCWSTEEGLQAWTELFEWNAQMDESGEGLLEQIVKCHLAKAKRKSNAESDRVILLLKGQGFSDAELSATLTPKSPPLLIELYLWKTPIDAMDYALQFCILMEQIREGRPLSPTTRTQEVTRQLDQGLEERRDKEEDYDRRMGELVLSDEADNNMGR